MYLLIKNAAIWTGNVDNTSAEAMTFKGVQFFIYTKRVLLKKGEVAFFDKAANNYALFDQWNEDEIFFITRLKNNAKEALLEAFEIHQPTPDAILRDAKKHYTTKINKDEKNKLNAAQCHANTNKSTRHITFLPTFLICQQNKQPCAIKKGGESNYFSRK